MMKSIGSQRMGWGSFIENLTKEKDRGLERRDWSVLLAFQNDRVGEFVQLGGFPLLVFDCLRGVSILTQTV